MFGSQMRDFAETLEGLRSFVDLVGPFLRSKGDQVFKRRANDLLPLLLAFAEMNPEGFKQERDLLSRFRKMFDGDIVLEPKRGGDENGVNLTVRGPQSIDFDDAMTEVRRAAVRTSLLYRNSLISLICAVESFLSQLIYAYFAEIPDAFSQKDKLFSFEDLGRFDSIADAKTYAVEKRVTDLMRGSFADWLDFFKTKPKLSMSYVEPYLDRLVEACERRNLIVHNAGIVNSIYISKVAPDLRKSVRKGEQLAVDRTYLDKYIDYFEQHSLLIGAELWKQLRPEDPERSDVLGGITYEHLKSGRWGIAEGLSYFQMKDMKMSEPSRLVGKLNYWLTKKELDTWDDVRAEISKTDFSAKGLRYQLALLALRGEGKAFFDLIPRALKGSEITLSELREFPIFSNMRRKRRFAEFRERPKPKPKPKAKAKATTRPKRSAGATRRTRSTSRSSVRCARKS